MDTMTPTRPAVQHLRRVSLPALPQAAAEARTQVTAAIFAWGVPVDSSVAALLTSELVTNAIRHVTGESVLLDVSCTCGQLRVDVHDTSWAMPLQDTVIEPAEAEAGRGLMLIDRLADEWGFYRTLAGKAVYFALAYPNGRHQQQGAA
jgi:anti-sigma regulatory factor (Ser/Thr protein kinase)